MIMPQDLRRKLKAAREKLGLSQSKFAAHIGVPPRTLQHWEQDRMTPDAFKLALLNEKLDRILAE
ncbi:MAG: family transcriptional regulator [Verrucomicrobiales bacterium]|nr:family transcriptional regulator [Verrucomicrobiales bacterium]